MPPAEERLEYMLALVCSTLANVNRGKSSRVFKPEDFLPKWGGVEKMDPAMQYKALECMARMHNATVEAKHGNH